LCRRLSEVARFSLYQVTESLAFALLRPVNRAPRQWPCTSNFFELLWRSAPATRFAISHPAVGTILVGMATPQQFEAALAAVEKGPLPPAAVERLTALRQGFAGEPR
jgi:aryl-alcohol dehydrogenase-like predicted oxidoreductase